MTTDIGEGFALDINMLLRLGAVILVGAAIIAAGMEVTRHEDEADVGIYRPRIDTPPGPLRATLRRCQDMGEAAMRDPACLKVWSEGRKRFLGSAAMSKTSAAQAPATLLPSKSAPVGSPIRKGSVVADEATPAAQPEPDRLGAQ